MGFEPGTEWSDASSGISDLEALSQTAATLGLIPSLALVGTALSPVPGDEAVVTMLLLGTGAAGVVSSGASLLDQWEHENLRLDSIQTQLDLLGLAGSLAVGGAGALRVASGSKALNVTQMNSAVLITEGVEGFSDGASGLLMSWVYWQQIQQIQQRHDLSEEEKQQQIEGVLQQAAQLGGIVLLGTVTTRQRSFEVEVKQRRATGEIDAEMEARLLEYNENTPRGTRSVDSAIEELQKGGVVSPEGGGFLPRYPGRREFDHKATLSTEEFQLGNVSSQPNPRTGNQQISFDHSQVSETARSELTSSQDQRRTSQQEKREIEEAYEREKHTFNGQPYERYQDIPEWKQAHHQMGQASERMGEVAIDALVETHLPGSEQLKHEIPGLGKSGQFDRIYALGDDVYIFEGKGAGGSNNDVGRVIEGGDYAQQGSKPYRDDIIGNMARIAENTNDTELKDTVNRLTRARRRGTLNYLQVSQKVDADGNLIPHINVVRFGE